MAYTPKFYGKLNDSSNNYIASGTLTLTPNAFNFTQNSDYHPNGNVKTWKLFGSLAEIRSKAYEISREMDELGVLGTRQVTTLNFNRVNGFRPSLIENGSETNDLAFTPIVSQYGYRDRIYMGSVSVEQLLSENPYNSDGSATVTIKSISFKYSSTAEEQPVWPNHFLIYGKYKDNDSTLFYIGSMSVNETESIPNLRVYDLITGDGRVESYPGIYFIPVTDIDDPALNIDISQFYRWYTTDYARIKAAIPKLAEWQYWRGSTEGGWQFWRYYGTFTSRYGRSDHTIGTNTTGGGYSIKYECTHNVYRQEAQAALYEGTVQRQYYSYSPSNSKVSFGRKGSTVGSGSSNGSAGGNGNISGPAEGN